jgi:hypothetical protein
MNAISRIFRKSVCVALISLTVPFFDGKAQSTTDYAIHANIVYHFTKYINWPASKQSGEFVIGVVGDSPLYDELKKITGNKTAGSQKINVKKFSPSQQSYDCHILFISDEESGSLKKITARTAGAPVLLVCEDEGAATRGACINFSIVSDRLKLEINKVNIEQRQLSIANELLRLGVVVK